jgi:hypothetical protein
MKVGGTSLSRMIRSQFPADQVFPGPPELGLGVAPALDPTCLASVPEGRRDRTRYFVAHLPYVARALVEPVRTFAFFREPLARVKSHLAHDRRHLERSGQPMRSAEEIYDAAARFPAWQNLQTKMFAAAPGELPNIFEPYAIDEERFERAQQHVRQLDFIGLTEDFERSSRLLFATFGWKLPPTLHANRGAPMTVSRELEERIIADHVWDYRLYEFVKALYEEQVRAIGDVECGVAS